MRELMFVDVSLRGCLRHSALSRPLSFFEIIMFAFGFCSGHVLLDLLGLNNLTRFSLTALLLSSLILSGLTL